MTSVLMENFKIAAAEQFIEMVTEIAGSNLYFTYGKTREWANEASPDNVNTSVYTEYDVWNNMIGAKKLTGNDIRHVIPRNDWTSGTVYDQYDHLENIYDTDYRFFVVTDEFNVYKCLYNNSGAASVSKPTTTNPSTIVQMDDGYMWKFMYTISTADKTKFTTSAFIPVKTLTVDDGSTQWDVQENAAEGALNVILLTNPGSGYSNGSNVIVTITGDGTFATATANVNTSTNVVSSILITDQGSGYSYANVAITGGGGSGAIARAIISPPGGHGSDPVYELGGSSIMINPRIKGTENGKLSVSNDFRQLAIIKDPRLWNSNTAAGDLVYSQTYDLSVDGGSGVYNENETLYQGSSINTSTMTGTLLEFISSNNLIKVVNVLGTINTDYVFGAETGTSKFVGLIDYPDLEPFSGKVLYVDNITPIDRNANQTEDFKIIIHF